MWRLLRSPVLTLPLVFFLFLTISTTVTSFQQEKKLPSLPLPTHLVYQFPNETWVENQAIRSNGDILVTVLSRPELYLVNTTQRSAILVHSFPDVTSLTGITEVEDDVFYIAAGNTSNITTRPLSFSIWEVDLRCFSLEGAKVRKVTDTPEAVFPNGLTTLSKANSTILIADCILGVVWRLNVKTGAYSVAISDPAMAPNASAQPPIGVDGVKIRKGYLYFTNANLGLMCRVPISLSGLATGGVVVLATGIQPDDFDLDREGRPWIAQNPVNLVSVLLRNGTVVNVAGATDQLTVAGPTSCLFGRLHNSDRGLGKGALLYCTTTGGIVAPVNGTAIEGGKVVVIDTEGF